jgi:hypothetical protein
VHEGRKLRSRFTREGKSGCFANSSTNELSTVDYHNLMLDRLDEVSDERVKALGEIER